MTAARKRKRSTRVEPTFFEKGLSALAALLLVWIRSFVDNELDKARGDAEGIDWLVDRHGDALALSAYVFGIRILDLDGIEAALAELARAGELVASAGRPGLYGLPRPKRSAGADRTRRWRERKRAEVASARGQLELGALPHEQVQALRACVSSASQTPITNVTGDVARDNSSASPGASHGVSETPTNTSPAHPVITHEENMQHDSHRIPDVCTGDGHGVTSVTSPEALAPPSSSESSSSNEEGLEEPEALTTEERRAWTLLHTIAARYNEVCAKRMAEVGQVRQFPKRWLLRELMNRLAEKPARWDEAHWEGVLRALEADNFFWHVKANKAGEVQPADLEWVLKVNRFGGANMERLETAALTAPSKPKAAIAPAPKTSTHAPGCIHGRPEFLECVKCGRGKWGAPAAPMGAS